MPGYDDKDRNSAEQLRAMQAEELEVLAEFFRSFADPTRIRILNVLAGGEICVGDLANALEMTQSAVSHQLKVLRASRLIKSRRDGKQILYSLDDDHVHKILRSGIEHIRQ